MKKSPVTEVCETKNFTGIATKSRSLHVAICYELWKIYGWICAYKNPPVGI